MKITPVYVPLFAVALASALSMNAALADSDNRQILCSTVNVTECRDDSGCETQSVLSSDTPNFLRLDLAKKSVETVWQGGRVESTTVTNVAHSDGLLIMQGLEAAKPGERGAIGWTMSLDNNNGRLVVSASGQGVGYTLFGSCLAL